MADQITAYEFADSAFVVGSDAIVCVARASELQSVMTLGEIEEAFSGYALYRQAPWMRRFVGVWGRKNCQRLGRFLRERGAAITLVRERPQRLRLGVYVTHGSRSKVRSLAQLNGAQEGS